MTFAAGLACEGMKPFAAIYSTFLQRAYDQVVHDVAIQKLPVRFAMDRAGLVGADGATHAGSFDLAYLGCLPGFVIMAAADEVELMHMVATCAAIDDGPSAVRYPRGEGIGLTLPARGNVLEIGRGRVVREGTAIALLSLGARLQECLKAADELDAPRPLHDGGGCALRQAARHRPGRASGARARGADHHRGRARSAASRATCCIIWRGPACSITGSRCGRWCCPTASSTTISPQLQYDQARLNARHIVETALGALGREALRSAIA